MQITNVKINGMKNPVGYAFDNVRVSWIIEDTAATAITETTIEVSKNSDFNELFYSKVDANLNFPRWKKSA